MGFRLVLTVALLVCAAACSQLRAMTDQGEQVQTHLPDGGPPVVDGVYYAWGSCPGEGCSVGDLLATAPVDLLDQPRRDARVVSAVPAGEWVRATRTVNLVRPRRGDVVGEVRNGPSSGPRLSVGDVVYYVDYEGEGVSYLWRRGDIISWLEESDVVDGVNNGIRWEPYSEEQRQADMAAGVHWWIEVERENGQRGWLRDIGGIDCIGDIDISDVCYVHRNGPPPAAVASPPFRDCDECPLMTAIDGTAYAAGVYEVTFAQWDACVAARGCNGYVPDDAGWGRGNRPVINVSSDDAQAYLAWLSRRSGHRYRLLTTDEWSFVALAYGGSMFYWGDNQGPSCDRAAPNGSNSQPECTQTEGPGMTLPVGAFRPNGFGLCDVHGNVWELVDGVVWPNPEPYQRMAMGGSYESHNMVSLAMLQRNATDRFRSVGFRVARDMQR